MRNGLLVVFFLLSASELSLGVTRFAKTTPTGTGDCTSWANACSMDRAINGNTPTDLGAQSGDEIWVKAGTYSSFSLPNGVKIIGGFAGTETLASSSNPVVNVTIVAGNGGTAVISDSSSPPTMLRGFKIINGSSGAQYGGGGAVLSGSSAKFVQCVFENNQATNFGAAVSIEDSDGPEFINCDFHGNGSGTSNIDVHPLAGGAIFLRSGTVKFTNCLFYNNKAGEGAVLASISGTASFANCTIANNQALVGYGGAIHDQDGHVTVTNSILWGNSAAKGGNQVFNYPGKVTPMSSCAVQGGWTGTGIISADPRFVNAGGNNYALQGTSPCKNVGSNSALPLDVADLDWDGVTTNENLPLDLARKARQNVVVDLGAYEIQFTGGGGPD